MAGEVARLSQVKIQVNELSNALSNAQEVQKSLLERLSSIRRSGEHSADGGQAKQAPERDLVPLADSLRDIVAGFNAVTAEYENALSQIEL